MAAKRSARRATKRPAGKAPGNPAKKKKEKKTGQSPATAPARHSPREGDTAPDFTLPTDSRESVTLSALRGRPVVVYFYPRDDTPGCTKEACGFNDALPDFSAVNAEIIGISKDTEASHARFRQKYGLRFRLAVDADIEVARAYGVWIEKSLYGRHYMGMDRATFLIDRDGRIVRAWRGVKVPGHVNEVLAAAQNL